GRACPTASAGGKSHSGYKHKKQLFGLLFVFPSLPAGANVQVGIPYLFLHSFRSLSFPLTRTLTHTSQTAQNDQEAESGK
ncbi:hypothetical protein, partial [Fulvivirga sedimenti]